MGISISTVSRALNGYTDVSAATRQRVFDAAKAMNYEPHPLAHRLATGKTGAVAIVSPTRDGRSVDNSIAVLHLAVSQALREQGFFTLSIVLAGGDQELVELNRLIAARLVDAMVLTRTRTVDARVQRLQERKIPFVTYGRTLENEPHAWVDWDLEYAFEQAVKALLAHGHRRIALINGMVHMSFASLIERSVCAQLKQAGINPSECPIHYTD
ncbi:MAG: LacI family DNA-binding transcriptional regulator [Brachymonas sp.]